MSELYVVDPDGDLIIIHHAPRESFAPWDHPEGLSDIGDGELDAETIETPSTPHDESTLLISPSPLPELRFKVSSKHLTLASHRFKKMLAGPYKEANLAYPDGCRQVTIDLFDSEALKILLNIIHGNNSKVPRSLSLEMVAKVSEWVNDLDCYEQVGVFGDIWIRQLENSLPKEYDRDLILWIFISFVFRQSGLFKSATQTAILHSTGPFQMLDLPIRSIIAERIDEQRLELLEQLITSIHGVVDDLCIGERRCTFECNSILLGALLMQIQPLGLWPRPSEPYTKFSFVGIAHAVRFFRSPHSVTHLHLEEAKEDSRAEEENSSFNRKKKKKGKLLSSFSWDAEEEAKGWLEPEPDGGHECSLGHLLVPGIDHLEQSVSGLDLEDIPSSGL